MKHLIPMLWTPLKRRYVGERYILGKDTFQLELLTNLDQLPTRGAIIYAISPKPKMPQGFLSEHSQSNHK